MANGCPACCLLACPRWQPLLKDCGTFPPWLTGPLNIMARTARLGQSWHSSSHLSHPLTVRENRPAERQDSLWVSRLIGSRVLPYPNIGPGLLPGQTSCGFTLRFICRNRLKRWVAKYWINVGFYYHYKGGNLNYTNSKMEELCESRVRFLKWSERPGSYRLLSLGSPVTAPRESACEGSVQCRSVM